MSLKGNKFGAFKGVFTPSILTILGVIMYLRLPWIVGQAGLWATLGIVLVAHIISATTGLSVASIATDKKVETGGTYYMISRSLGLPIGGTLGLALFVGLSFSVSLYLIGFAETLLTAFGIESTLNAIRITGAATLLVVTIITFISTNLALKMQFVILAVLLLSLVSIVLGKHDMVPQTALMGSATNSLPWIALFAIFFPAVTGFEAGVSMSGDLANPKKSIPVGTISAIIVGLVVYIGLVLFFSFTVDRNALINDSGILLKISLYSPLVLAGIWGATLSSAFGSILGAPRILQATAIDRITPKIFAKGVGAGNEPRNALLLTFLIALSGILIGELNVIARVVSIFFIITYGFLNLTCAIENWAGSDFRPSFRIPAWISIIGAMACFVVMIQLDFAAMVGATILLGSIFLLLKRRELRLQTGDTWGGIWASLVKYGLFKLSLSTTRNQRNWRPNIILFSGGAKARPHLIDLGRMLVGKQGVFTNFELVENPQNDDLFVEPASASTEIDHRGKSVITRKHSCNNVYDGMQMIARVYGFTGFEPNTILMGWGKNSKDSQKFCETATLLSKLDYNQVYYNHPATDKLSKPSRIDLWWNGNSRNLNFGLSLLKYLTTDNDWRTATVRLMIVNYNSVKTDSIYALASQALDNSRLLGNVKVINNAVEKIAEEEIIRRESADAGMVIVESNQSKFDDYTSWIDYVNKVTDLPCSSLIIEANSNFEAINAYTIPDVKNEELQESLPASAKPVAQQISYPPNELLAGEIQKIASTLEHIQNDFTANSILSIQKLFAHTHDDMKGLCMWLIGAVEKGLSSADQSHHKSMARKALSEFTFQAKSKLSDLTAQQLSEGQSELEQALKVYLLKTEETLNMIPDKLLVGFSRSELVVKRSDPFRVRFTKMMLISRGTFLGWPMNRKVELQKATRLFLFDSRNEDFSDFFTQVGLSSYRYVSNIRKILIDLGKTIEHPAQSGLLTKDELDSIRKDFANQLSEVYSDFCNSNKQNIAALKDSLQKNLQRLSFVLGKPESSLLLRPYQRLVRKQGSSAPDIESAPQIWYTNLKLYVGKVHVEYLLMSLKYRFSIKIARQVDEINVWARNNLLKSIEQARLLLSDLKSSSEMPDISPLLKRMNGFGRPSMQNRFEDLFREVSEVVAELPEDVEVNSDQFFSDLDKGLFLPSDSRSVPLRRKVELYVGMEFVSKTRVAMEAVSDSLKTSSDKLRDKIRLAAFNIENIVSHDETLASEAALVANQRNKLFGELLKEISVEEQKIIAAIQEFERNLNQFLQSSLEPLQQIIHTKLITDPKSRAKRKTRKSFGWLSQFFKSIGNFTNRQLVSILYSQSEGLMLAKRLTQLDKDEKLSNQSIHDVLMALSGVREVQKKIPFYYANLFSGSTTLNRELWVDRPHEQAIAEQIASRYRKGFSGGLLITGLRNAGKTTLSKFIAKAYFPQYSLHVVKPPIGGSASLEVFNEALRKALKTEGDPYDFLSSQTQRKVFIINDLELWWERHEDGLSVLQQIVSLIETFSSSNFFIINCNSIAYQLINRVVRFDQVFIGRIDCQPFDAKDLKDLVMSRHHTGGLNLVLNGRNESELSEWNFARLFNKIFNVTNGNPGFTLQLWLRSINRLSGKTVYVKTPVIPNTAGLGDIDEELLMVILQLIIHRRSDTKRLARALRLWEQKVESLLIDMKRAGLVEERFTAVYAVNSLLEPYLLEVLKDKGLC